MIERDPQTLQIVELLDINGGGGSYLIMVMGIKTELKNFSKKIRN